MKTLSFLETFAFQEKLRELGFLPEKPDGDWGDLTQAAFEKWVGIPSVPSAPEFADNPVLQKPGNNGDRLFAHALKDKGLLEIPGPASAKRIERAILDAAEWLDDDDSKTAWCGCIMGAWCRETGLPVPKECFRAANWLSVGVPVMLADAREGDIVVLKRSGGFHVALFAGIRDAKVRLFGGNQSNSVNFSLFPLSLVMGVRRV